MTCTLPTALHTAANSRELDRRAIEQLGIAGAHLMQRAGRAAFNALLQRWPEVEQIHVCCGTGNNGGDGFVIAALAQARGIPVSVWQVGDPAKIGGDALLAKQMAEREGVVSRPFDASELKAGVIGDALLGTGLGGDVRAPFLEAIAAINDAGLPVLALDIPSGLCSDTGSELGLAVRADLTVTFIAAKQGLLTGRGPACCGELRFDDLQLPTDLLAQVAPSSRRLDLDDLNRLLPRRARDAHKGHFGHLLVIGGDHGFGGAALMAAEAAGRLGAGLVSCATRAEHLPAFLARRPELMAHAVRSGQELAPLLARATAIVIGPGLGQSGWSEQLLAAVLASDLPLVVDADALNLLARLPLVRRDNWLLTPHPGEAARLLGSDTAAIGRDRVATARALQQRFGGAVILKGSGSLVVDGDGVSICPYGNPGMASGGMGDVLSGVLGGLLTQHLSVDDAARLGVCLHGRAADLAAAQQGERGLLATDLIPYLHRLANPS